MSPVILESTFKPGMVSHECNLNSWETEAEVFWELKATLGCRVHSNQLGLQSKTLSQTTAKPLWILQKNACLSVTCYRRPLVRSFRGLLSIMNTYFWCIFYSKVRSTSFIYYCFVGHGSLSCTLIHITDGVSCIQCFWGYSEFPFHVPL